MEIKEGHAVQRHHISSIIIILFGLLLLASGTYIFLSLQKHTTETITSTQASLTPTQSISVATWKTYTDTSTGMSIMYPPDWTFKTRANNNTSFTLTSPDNYTLSFIYGIPYVQQVTTTQIPTETFTDYKNIMLNHIVFTKAYVPHCVEIKGIQIQNSLITPTTKDCLQTIDHVTISTKVDITKKVIPQVFSWNDKQTLFILYPPAIVKATDATFLHVDAQLTAILEHFILPTK